MATELEIKVDHRELGLEDDQILEIYRTMLLARRLDDRMWALNRQGRAAFVVSSSGHEAVQVASAFAMDRSVDWALPYYRDMGMVLAWGMTPKEILLGVFSRADDPSSGGLQMPSHWSHAKKRIFTHSSPIATQFPHAAGIAYVLRQRGEPGVVIVSGGEASTSEGDWHEAMNFAGIHDLPVIFLIENNQYAISVPTSEQVAGQIADRAQGYGFEGLLIDGNDVLTVYAAVRQAADRAREGGGPTLIEASTYRYYAHTSDDDDRLYRPREEVESWRKHDPVPLLARYLVEQRLLTEEEEARIDEEVTAELGGAVEEADAAPEPDDPMAFVYAKPIEPGEAATAVEPEPQGEELNLITAINRALHEMMEAFPDVLVFGEDVADPKGGVFKATRGLTDTFGRDRCFNTPLSESLIAGLAVGMAAAGARPLPEMQFADFSHPAFDQIVSEMARIHYRSKGTWGSQVVIRSPYGGGIHGALYHSQSIEAFYAHVPGMKVVIPSTPADVKGLLWSAVEDPDPVLFLEPKKLYRLVKGPYPKGEHRVPLGRAAVRRLGSDLTVVAYGTMAHYALQAAEQLFQEGISAEVIDLRSIKPLDWPTIEASVRKTAKLLVVHEDNEFAGFGAEIAAQAADRAFTWLDGPVRRYATPDVPCFPFNSKLEAMVMPDVNGIVERATELAHW